MGKEMHTPLVGVNTSGSPFWAAVSSQPNKTTFDLSQRKVVTPGFLIEVVGQYDQSVGSETQATEGNTALIQEMHLVLDGVTRRVFPGPVLFEIDRLIAQGPFPQVDPATGIATNKVFSCKYWYPMTFLDMAREVIPGRDGRPRMKDVASSTLLDLNNYTTAVLEILWNPFNAFVSGNTQANINLTSVKATMSYLPGKRIAMADQRHFELRLAAAQDMSQSVNDKLDDLFRANMSVRGLLCRVGTLSATPIITAMTALTNMGVQGIKVNGDADVLKDKLPVSTYQGLVAWPRVGIQLRAGYIWVDFASDAREPNLLRGADYSSLQARFDIVGTSSTTMQIWQAVRTI
jgi:hypothetical protein